MKKYIYLMALLYLLYVNLLHNTSMIIKNQIPDAVVCYQCIDWTSVKIGVLQPGCHKELYSLSGISCSIKGIQSLNNQQTSRSQVVIQKKEDGGLSTTQAGTTTFGAQTGKNTEISLIAT